MAAERIELLARRVRWLDDYRRGISFGTALVLAPIVNRQLSITLGTDWPQIHGLLLTLVICLFAWGTAEVALAWTAAFWETEHDRLVHDHRLPRAELLRRRK